MSDPRSILLVDDDEDIRDALVLVLAGEGYSTKAARDGVDALEVLHSAPPPALILLDMMMPRMNGVEVLDAVRSDPTLASVPVVVFSGNTDAAQSATALGADACLAKPFDVEELLTTVARYISYRHP
jgi:CheY-like chemotaxis protein